MRVHRAVVIAALLAGLGGGDPSPLAGSPPRGPSGLHLLVASNPPFVLDVDTGRIAPVRAPVAMKRGILWVASVGGTAGVVVARYPKSLIYAVRGRRARPVFLGSGRVVVPGSDGKSVWIKTVDGPVCSLRHVALDGRRLSEAQPFDCNSTIEPGAELGLIASGTRVFDPSTGQTVLTTRYGVLAAAGKRLLLQGPEKAFTLLDTVTGVERTISWPSVLYGLDEPKVDRQGRFVALGFADPAWQSSYHQAMDVWVLDTESGDLTHVAGMPAFVSLKFTSMEWTTDGRLVFLGETREKGFVAIWRSGRTQLEIRRVRLPERTSGSDSFAVLR
jgi:hypothetical protein